MRFEEFVLQMWYLHKDECFIYGDEPLSLLDYSTLHEKWLQNEFVKSRGEVASEHFLSE
jgi:hypothetical protein